MTHKEPHWLAGHENALVVVGRYKGEECDVEDWWDRVSGGSWMFADGNPACLDYAIRGAADGLPTDNEVVYVKFGMFGKLLHVSELEG